MEDLVAMFRKVYSSECSPVEVIAKLAANSPDIVHIRTIRGESDQSMAIYSSTISINGRTFVVCDQCEAKSLEIAASQAVAYLKEIVTFPNLFDQDEELYQIVVALTSLGFSIKYEDNSTMSPTAVYQSKIKIIGMGEFSGESQYGKNEAFERASVELKSFYFQTLAMNIFGDFSQSPLVDAKSAHLQEVSDNSQPKLELYPLPEVSRQFDQSRRLLSSDDRKWIELINRFNLAYTDSKPVVTMNKLIETKLFTICTTSFVNKKAEKLFKSTLNFANLKSFNIATPSQSSSEEKVKILSFKFFTKLSEFLTTFKNVYSETKTVDKNIQEICVKQNDNLIKWKTLRKSKSGYETIVDIFDLNAKFSSVGKDVKEAKTNALVLAMNYLKRLTCEIRNVTDEPQSQKPSQQIWSTKHVKSSKSLRPTSPLCLSNPPKKSSPKQTRQQAMSKTNYTNQRICTSFTQNSCLNNFQPSAPIQIAQSSQVCIEGLISHSPTLDDYQLIELINRFNSVYNRMPRIEELFSVKVMDKMIEENVNMFEIKSYSQVTRDGTGTLYKTRIKHIALGFTFYGLDKCQTRSRHNALNQPFDYLQKLSRLIAHFKSVYNPAKSIFSYKDIFIAENDDMIFIQTNQAESGYFARITLGHNWKQFCGNAGTEDGAELEAFSKLVDYLQMYSQRIHQLKPYYSDQTTDNRFNQNGHGLFNRLNTNKRNNQNKVQHRGNRSPQFRPRFPPPFNRDCNKAIKLLIQFCSVYDAKKQPIEVMEELMETAIDDQNQSVFSFVYKPILKPSKIKGAEEDDEEQFETVLTIDKFCSLTATDKTVQKSRDKVLKAAFDLLKNLKELLETFNSEIYSPGKSTSEVMALLEARHGDVVKYKHKRGSNRVRITIVNFGDFHASNANKEVAASRMINFLKRLCEGFRLEKMKAHEISSEDSSRRMSVCYDSYEMDDDMCSVYSWEELELVERVPTTSVTKHDCIKTCQELNSVIDESILKTANLINHFNTVEREYPDSAQSPHDFLIKLSETKTIRISFVNIPFPDGFVAQVTLIGFGQFDAFAEIYQQSMNYASQKAINFIKNLANLICQFKKLADSDFSSPSNLIDVLIKDNGQILKVNTQKEGDFFYTEVVLKNIKTFTRFSKEEVSTDVIEYLRQLAEA